RRRVARRGGVAPIVDQGSGRARRRGAVGDPRPARAASGGREGLQQSRRGRPDPRGRGSVVRRVSRDAAPRATARTPAVVRMTPFGMNDLAFSIVLGTALGVGVCLVLSLAPRWGAPSLARRIAPYIRD